MVLLGSLNSCCNPWIYLAFSGNLIRHSCPQGYRRDQTNCCSQKLCHLIRRHPYRRRRNGSINNNLEDNSQRSQSYEHVINSRAAQFADVELRELILNGSSRKWQTCKRPSSPDTAACTTTSKTVVSKTRSPKVSQHSLKKESLYKMVLQHGRLQREADWAYPVQNNEADKE